MTSDAYVPTPEDKFSFGIWTVGWQGVDVFGSAVRPAMPADRAVRKLAELGAYGVNFHDNDVFDFEDSNGEREAKIAAFRKALDETGLVVTTATTNLFGHPVFKDGAFTANEREIRRFALAKVMRNLDLAADLGAKTYVFWGGREGAESGAAKDIRALFFVSTFVGTFLPASVGGDAVRAFGLARLRVPAAFSVASVFMDRMLGV